MSFSGTQGKSPYAQTPRGRTTISRVCSKCGSLELILVRLTLHPLQLRRCEFQLAHSLRPLISDIGGSSVNDDEPHSLGHITFRWMMQEIDRSGCGILFDYHSLRDLGIPPDSVPTPSKMHYHAAAGSHSIIPSPKVAPDNESSTSSSSSQHQNEGAGCLSFFRTLKYKLMKYNTKPKETLPEQASKPCAELDEIDVLERINDELSKHPFFWRMFQTPRWYPGSILCVSLLRSSTVPGFLEYAAIHSHHPRSSLADDRFSTQQPRLFWQA